MCIVGLINVSGDSLSQSWHLTFPLLNNNKAFDISADLTELGKTPVAVVCAGVKSILDIEKTLEVLVSARNKRAGMGSNVMFIRKRKE